jgi:hypothetical protein
VKAASASSLRVSLVTPKTPSHTRSPGCVPHSPCHRKYHASSSVSCYFTLVAEHFRALHASMHPPILPRLVLRYPTCTLRACCWISHFIDKLASPRAVHHSYNLWSRVYRFLNHTPGCLAHQFFYCMLRGAPDKEYQRSLMQCLSNHKFRRSFRTLADR